jgi:ABC-type phosphate transport system auxiliary subunit
MWFVFLSFLPDWFVSYFVHIIFGAGLVGIIAGAFLSKIPFVNQYGVLIKIVSNILFVVGLFLEGGLQTELAWREKVAELQAKIEIAQQQSKESNAKIEKKLAEKVKTIKDNVNANRQTIEENRSSINAECKLSDTAWLLYNNASQNALAGSTSKSVGTGK